MSVWPSLPVSAETENQARTYMVSSGKTVEEVSWMYVWMNWVPPPG